MKQKIINTFFCIIIVILNEFIIQAMGRANSANGVRVVVWCFIAGILIFNFGIKDKFFKI